MKIGHDGQSNPGVATCVNQVTRMTQNGIAESGSRKAEYPALRYLLSAIPSELCVDPVHVRAQLLALALDLVVLALLAHALEVLLAGAVLGDPLAREIARLDLAEDVLHRLAALVGDDALAARE